MDDKRCTGKRRWRAAPPLSAPAKQEQKNNKALTTHTIQHLTSTSNKLFDTESYNPTSRTCYTSQLFLTSDTNKPLGSKDISHLFTHPPNAHCWVVLWSQLACYWKVWLRTLYCPKLSWASNSQYWQSYASLIFRRRALKTKIGKKMDFLILVYTFFFAHEKNLFKLVLRNSFKAVLFLKKVWPWTNHPLLRK